MQPNHNRRRLIILCISVVVMLALFFFSAQRASDSRLPAIPTPPPETNVVLLAEAASPAQSSLHPLTPTASVTRTTAPPSTTPTQTITPTRLIDSQATVQIGMAKATQRARAMSDIVKVLAEDGAVSTIEGTYNRLDDVAISFNKPGYYSLTFSEFRANNFVLRANVLWSNAGDEISYPTAGCGFIFGYQEMNNQNRVILTLDGNVRMQNITDSITDKSVPEYYGELEKPAGHANLILAVDQGWISMYINNTLVTRLYRENLTDGWVGYLVQAGSGTDYGTLCEYKDIELWHVE